MGIISTHPRADALDSRATWSKSAPAWGQEQWILSANITNTSTTDEATAMNNDADDQRGAPTDNPWYQLWWHPPYTPPQHHNSVAPNDPWLDRSRYWLQLHHAELYNHPSGWRTFPTCHTRTAQWFNDICWTPQQYRKTHHRTFHLIWTTIRGHWNRTCATNIEQIQTANNMAALHAANLRLMTKRSQYDHMARTTTGRTTSTRTRPNGTHTGRLKYDNTNNNDRQEAVETMEHDNQYTTMDEHEIGRRRRPGRTACNYI
jgi:hypothetical protein